MDQGRTSAWMTSSHVGAPHLKLCAAKSTHAAPQVPRSTAVRGRMSVCSGTRHWTARGKRNSCPQTSGRLQNIGVRHIGKNKDTRHAVVLGRPPQRAGTHHVVHQDHTHLTCTYTDLQEGFIVVPVQWGRAHQRHHGDRRRCSTGGPVSYHVGQRNEYGYQSQHGSNVPQDVPALHVCTLEKKKRTPVTPPTSSVGTRHPSPGKSRPFQGGSAFHRMSRTVPPGSGGASQ